jgi:hypothetical protein
MTTAFNDKFLTAIPSRGVTAGGVTITQIAKDENRGRSLNSNYLANVPDSQEWASRLLEPILDVEDNWDGYNGQAPAARAIEVALNLLTIFKLDAPGLTLPEVEPVRDGGISLIWVEKEKFLEIEIGVTSVVSYVFRMNCGDSYQGSTFYLDSLPSRLKMAVKLFSE